ncbi:MAG: hypothetical protein HQK51_05455 [Oligoflexia bacterium]|nr:hypothetical protein [Oligoflexia bacterium]
MLNIFKSLFKLLYHQINQGIKKRMLIVFLKLIVGIRLFIIFSTVIIVSAIMSAISLFAGITNVIQQYSASGYVVFDYFLIFSSIVFVFSLLLFFVLTSERTWLKILKIDQMIKKNAV